MKEQKLIAEIVIYIAIMILAVAAIMSLVPGLASASELEDIAFCQQYKAEAEKQRDLGRRYEYQVAKQIFQACLNTAKAKKWKNKPHTDIGTYLQLHKTLEQEQWQQIDENLLVSKYAN